METKGQAIKPNIFSTNFPPFCSICSGRFFRFLSAKLAGFLIIPKPSIWHSSAMAMVGFRTRPSRWKIPVRALLFSSRREAAASPRASSAHRLALHSAQRRHDHVRALKQLHHRSTASVMSASVYCPPASKKSSSPPNRCPRQIRRMSPRHPTRLRRVPLASAWENPAR
jgi:hypothetical protein